MKNLLFFLPSVLFALQVSAQNIYTVAGNGYISPGPNFYGSGGYTGDGGPATLTELNNPDGVAVDANGSIYIADYNNFRIRKVDVITGIISTVAGNGTYGYSGDGGPATSAEFDLPYGIAVDGNGNIYIADGDNGVIRKVDALTGIITTVAGNSTEGYSGDGGAATSAELNEPISVAVDASGNIYIDDLYNNRIRKVDAISGIITTVAGNGTAGNSGDGDPATSAELNGATGVAVDANGNIYIVDGTNRIRKVDAVTGIINTVAGNGNWGYSGDNGPATSAEINDPTGVAIDANYNLYISDHGNNRIRKVDAATGIITTIAGNGTGGYTGDGGLATSAEFVAPNGVAVDANGNVYIDDFTNNVIREVGAIHWTGYSSADWNTALNWSSDLVPTSTTDMVIPSGLGTYPVISRTSLFDYETGSLNNLTIESGANLTVHGVLDVYGNFTNNGTASLGSGTIYFDGAVAQTIYGTSAMTNVEVDNSNGVTIDPSGSVSVSDVLTLKTGTLTTNSNLTLTSTSTSQVAMIDNFSSESYNGSISGNITAQRYYAASETYNQHFMGSPVDAPALTQFGASGTSGYITPLVDCDETQLLSGSPASNVYAMVKSAPGAAECGLAEWDALTSGNAVDGEGYSVYLVGAGTLSLSGSPNLNTSYTLPGLTNSNWESTTLQGRNVGSGWHLLSNPYSATLNISSNGGSGFDNQVQVWITEGGNARTYQMYTPGSNATVSAFQGFMVHVTTPGTTPTYTFNGSDRSLTAATFSRVADQSELVVKATNTGTGLTDYTTVAFNSDATPAFDPQYDGNKLAGSLTRHTLYTTIADGQWMALNTLPSVAQAGEVPMGFEPGVDGNYTLSFAGLTSFDANTTIMLQDKLTNTLYNVQNGDYKFTAKATDNWDRFNLIFSTASTTGITTVTGDNNIPVWSYQNKVNVDFSQLKDVKANVTIYDLLGQEIVSENYEGNNIYTKTLDNVDAAFMIVKVVNGDQLVTKKVFITNAK